MRKSSVDAAAVLDAGSTLYSGDLFAPSVNGGLRGVKPRLIVLVGSIILELSGNGGEGENVELLTLAEDPGF